KRARLAAVSAIGLALASAGCASTGGGGIQVEMARTGEQVVHVNSSCSFDDVARRVWGNEQRGREIAAMARLPYDQPVPRGTLLALPPADPETVAKDTQATADTRFRAGVAAAKNGSNAEAIARFREALLLDPQRVDIRFNLGLALLEDGQLTEATPILEEV